VQRDPASFVVDAVIGSEAELEFARLAAAMAQP
jgi:hypothetical protein